MKDIFDICYLVYSTNLSTQREFSEALNFSLGKTNTTLQNAIDLDYVNSENGYKLTKAGFEFLSKYKVDNAIIMAAGMSSRFAPLSFEKPKGLLEVKGEILIERQIKQLHEVGITDITIVLGYMKEKFFYLEQKFGVKIVVNEDYYKYNNTSTLMLVLDELKNTYICSSDNYFAINVFREYEFASTYPVQKHDFSEEGEYYAIFNKQGLITDVKIGSGEYCMIGNVFFDQEFSTKFKDVLVKEYEKEETKTKLWEKLYVENLDKFTMYARVYDPMEILEFDSLKELQEYDSYYLNNTDSAILNNIMNQLECEMKDITDISPVKEGLTNTSFKFTVQGTTYIYRHPGIGTDQYINRKGEAFAQKVAKEQGLDDTFIYMNEKEGWKLSYFIDDAVTLDYHNENQVKTSLEKIKSLHDAAISGEFDFDIWEKTKDFIKLIEKKGRHDFKDFDKLLDKMTKVYEFTTADNYPKVLCHCDFFDPNILFKGEDMYLIDWEYAGNDDPGVDLGTYIACSDYTLDQASRILDIYDGGVMNEERKRHFIGYISIASYYWFMWAIFQESNGAAVGEYLYIWYKNSYLYADIALEMYGK